MIDGNTAALNSYERRVMKHDMIESMFNSDIEPIIREIENLATQVRNLVTYYEDEHNLDFSDDAHEAMLEALR